MNDAPTKPKIGKGLPGESSHISETLKQVIECHQHSSGDLAKLLPCTVQRNHPPSLPAPESEDFPRLPIRLFADHDELLSMIVFHDEPFHIHATSSPFFSFIHQRHYDDGQGSAPFLRCPACTPYDMSQFILVPPCVSLPRTGRQPAVILGITAGLAGPGRNLTRRWACWIGRSRPARPRTRCLDIANLVLSPTSEFRFNQWQNHHEKPGRFT